MAKLFYIHEVDELMDNTIKNLVLETILAETEDEAKVMEAVTASRYYKQFAKLVTKAMREEEAEEDRRYAEFRRAVKKDEPKEEPKDGGDS